MNITLFKTLRDRFGKKQNRLEAQAAVLGDGYGAVVVAGKEGWVYCKIADEPAIEIFNNRVPPEHGLNVWVGYDPLQPNLFQVLSRRDNTTGIVAQNNPSYAVLPHHESHEYPEGRDIVWVQQRQYMPLRVDVVPGQLKLWVHRDVVPISNGKFGLIEPNLPFDMLAYRPSSTGNEGTKNAAARFVSIYVDNDGEIKFLDGEIKTLETLTLDDVPNIPNARVFAAVRMYEGQTQFYDNIVTDRDILDLRSNPGSFIGTGEAGQLAKWIDNFTLGGQAGIDSSQVTSGTLAADRLPLFTTTQPGAVPAPGTISNKVLRDDGTWVTMQSGGGDMLKAVYDTDDDGVVDAAESVTWSGVTGKPSTYPPDAHQHAAGDVTSGTFDAARIPNLDASKITSGTLSTDRYSAYSDLGAESYLGANSDQIVRASDWKLGQAMIISEDFPNTSPSGFSWAGSPFSTPPSITSSRGTRLVCGGFSSASRAFLYKSATASQICLLTGSRLYIGDYVGIRHDDGSDNNYIELVWEKESDGSISIREHKRSGGGSVTSTQFANFPIVPYMGWLNITKHGTLHSNWGTYSIFADLYNMSVIGYSYSLTWTPSRMGIVMRLNSDQQAIIDAWGNS